MAEAVSREVWFLRQVERQEYSSDFVQNITQLNNTMTSVSKYLIGMQKGIDDLDRDIFEVIQDFIEEIIIIFGGGEGGDSGFLWGDLKYIFQAIGGLFGLGNGILAVPAAMAQFLFSTFLAPLAGFAAAVGGIVAGAVGAVMGGFGTVLDAIFGTIDNDYVADLPIVNDHSQTIGQMRAELDQLTIHGMARVLTGDGYYHATPGTVRAEVIMIAAGGGGGTGRWDLAPGNHIGGSGGGGGGENHFTIHGSSLFEDDGSPRAIPYFCGAPGNGGQSNDASGNGGGNTTFDGIPVYGGQGGRRHGGLGVGGYGIVNGGSATPDADISQIDSLSGFGLFGGGGAGGRGASGSGNGSPGGRGGLNPGGAAGIGNGRGGDAPLVAPSVPTGGGGGGGGGYQNDGGTGAFPGGGGGGGGTGRSAGAGAVGKGGMGAQGSIYIIERAF